MTIATGVGLIAAAPSQASTTRLYFHSAAGGYLADWENDPESFDRDAAPNGSTMDTKAPTKATDAKAQSTSPYRWAGLPTQPSFSFPFVGDVTTLCIDLWVQSTDSAANNTVIVPVINTPDATLLFNDVTAPAGTGPVRVTAMAKPKDAAKFTVPKDSELIIAGYILNDPDFTLLYDSAARPSSVIPNATECTPGPVVAPAPTTAAPTSAAPTSAAPTSAAPSATATPSASASATVTPSGSATPSATSTPSPSPTTPPPPARETGLSYTGATAGRYSDSAPVSARVTLPDGSPVPAGSVEFALGSGKVTLPVNSSGVASGRMPVRAGAGEQILVARYVSNSAYLGSAREVPFTVSRMPSKCAISRTTSGRSYVITGVLRDAAGRAIIGQTVYFAFNGTTHHAVRTDRYGKASLTVPTRSGTHTTSLRTNSFYSGCAASLRV